MSVNNIKDWHILLIIYIVTLIITLRFAVCEQEIVSDQHIEYDLYLYTVETGVWSFQQDNIVNSCPVVTCVPALIQRVTGWDKELWFKIYPMLIYSLMPVFVYLTARLYTGKLNSLLSVILVLSFYYFSYYPAMGRVSVAWGLLSGCTYYYIREKYLPVFIFGVALIFTHYGTGYIMMILYILSLTLSIYRHKFNIKAIAISLSVFAVLALIIYIWHFNIAQESGRYTIGVVSRVFDTQGVYAIESRETVVQSAVATGWWAWNIPQKIEFVLSWLVVVCICTGYLLSQRYNLLSDRHFLCCGICIILIMMTIHIPYLSKVYGVSRVYFTSLPLLAPLYVVTGEYLPVFNRKVRLTIMWCLVILYAIFVSGIGYQVFGIVKGG